MSSKRTKPPKVDGSHTINFGKYVGLSLDKIAEIDPSYILWLDEANVFRIETARLDVCRMDTMAEDEDFRDIFEN